MPSDLEEPEYAGEEGGRGRFEWAGKVVPPALFGCPFSALVTLKCRPDPRHPEEGAEEPPGGK